MLGAAGQTPRASPPPPLPPGALRGLCAWLDGLPLSRPKRHLARDFSDGVMLAEIVKHFYPRLVDLHNYVPTCNTDRKLSNWSTLNSVCVPVPWSLSIRPDSWGLLAKWTPPISLRATWQVSRGPVLTTPLTSCLSSNHGKVFHKLRLWVSETDIRKVVANTPGAIEPILCALREKVTDGAAHQHPPGTAGPGPSGGIADGPWAELCAPRHAGGIRVPGFGELRPRQREEFALREGRGVLASDTTQAAASQVGALGLSTPHAGLPGPTAASSVKTPQTPEKTGCCVCTGGGPAGGPWGHLDSGLQQLLEEKEQALAVLQEMVKFPAPRAHRGAMDSDSHQHLESQAQRLGMLSQGAENTLARHVPGPEGTCLVLPGPVCPLAL
ncbi:uncharacterized protein LOC115286030 isoform X2 [Suricata suricatta]|uniref:Calponin-homology (CH) domain-containing protein n=1 Tax=Suricata suricatta TaxID=37032 RepID=A0A673SXU0_SURSU|nr:uncharacterized protein LOC115286030 isoform X2 [Suricata suricatta]